ncbi:MAG TPA: DUF1854 domain-containing protein, partial [Victivallales bacterium]|nr:DUF1854 domain-containing protein [Victivallales bacterium]
RYFVPEIIDIKNISTKYGGRKKTGMCEINASTDRGPKIIHIFNPRENITLNSNGVIMITDIQRNRYKITNVDKLSEKARRNLDLIML